ncbi:site-2 protease family protein [Candidatus Daviesbacteria bacterium]|nr:site-2 protease family protein [Candidatus Daviesbacteria bacterium]
MDPIYLTSAVIILLLSIIIHEVMHGLVALKFGDTTAQRAGRLTLNPLPHIDLIGTVLLPALLILPSLLTGTSPGFIIGWAKPVPVNPLNFSNLRLGELMVSIAGVGSNFALAAVGALLYHLLNPTLGPASLIILLARFTVTVNLVLGIFNIIPIPPLDGSKVLMSRLPYKLALEYEKLAAYGFFLILLLYLIQFNGISLLGLFMGIGISSINTLLQVPLLFF